MTSTAAALTEAGDLSRKPDLLAMFDIDGGHARIESRLRKALDGNGASGSDLQVLERNASIQAICIVAETVTHWSFRSRAFAGRAKGDVEYVSPSALKQVMSTRCEEWSASNTVMNLLRSKLASETKVGMSLPAEIPLGTVPHTVGCEERCSGCYGLGSYNCHLCQNGQAMCRHCMGHGDLHVTGERYRVRCTTCFGRRTVQCIGCAGAGSLQCTPCGATGIITTLAEGSVSAKVAYRTEALGGFDPDWHAALTKRGHTWLIDISKHAGAPKLVEAPGSIQASWSIALQVLDQRFEVLGKAYKATFVGNKEAVWSMPHFLDATAKPIAASMASAAPTEAFAIADRHPLAKSVRGVVLEGGDDEDVRRQFASAVSPEFVQGMRLTLQKARDSLASHAIGAAWRRAIPISLLLVAYGVGTGLFGRLLPKPNGRMATSDDLNLLLGFVALCILFAASYWFAGNAGRNALKVALGTSVKRMPPQGRTPAVAGLAAVALFAGVGFTFHSSEDTPIAVTASPARAASASASPELYEGILPKVSPPTVPFAGR
jgi:hypothetical protein